MKNFKNICGSVGTARGPSPVGTGGAGPGGGGGGLEAGLWGENGGRQRLHLSISNLTSLSVQ